MFAQEFLYAANVISVFVDFKGKCLKYYIYFKRPTPFSLSGKDIAIERESNEKSVLSNATKNLINNTIETITQSQLQLLQLLKPT